MKKEYRIITDDLNIIVQEKKVNKKNDEEYWVSLAYYGTIESALKFVVDKKIKDAWVDDLKQMTMEIQSIHNDLKGWAKAITETRTSHKEVIEV